MSLWLSGGHPGQLDGCLERFCAHLRPERKLLYIPHGRPHAEWLQAAREVKAQLAPYGVQDFILEADLHLGHIRQDDCAGVLIADGELRALYKALLAEAGGYSFRPWLQRAHDSGVPILAVGRAAVLMGKDLRTDPRDFERLESQSQGFNFLGGASVRCPVETPDKPQGPAFPLWQIPPDAGLQLDAQGITLLGRSEVSCWLPRRHMSYAPGTHLSLG